MTRFSKRSIIGEKGQALTIVLIFLAIGGLTIAVNLNYAASNLKGNQITKREMAGIYAAGSGIEYDVWSLKKGLAAPTSLTENLSGMSTSISTINKGTQTLVLTGWTVLNQSHPEYIGIDTATVWDAGANAYRVTITLTWQVTSGSSKIVIQGIGTKIPVGYNLQAVPGPSGMSTSAPTVTGNSSSGYVFTWDFSGMHESDRPTLDNPTPHTLTEIFYITGSGSADGGYSWVTTNRNDIGTVGEISGTLYKITSDARRLTDNQITSEIVSDVMIRSGGGVTILSWQITK